jgi:hypothetical protein
LAVEPSVSVTLLAIGLSITPLLDLPVLLLVEEGLWNRTVEERGGWLLLSRRSVVEKERDAVLVRHSINNQ